MAADPGSNGQWCPGCGLKRVPYDDGTMCAECNASGGPEAFEPPEVEGTISGPAAQAETVWLDQLRMIRGLQRKLKKKIHACNARGVDVEGYDPKLANEVVKLNRASATALEHVRKNTNKAGSDVSKMTIEQRAQLAVGFLKRKQVLPEVLRAAIAELVAHLAEIDATSGVPPSNEDDKTEVATSAPEAQA